MKEIILTQGKIAIVDDCDYDWLSQFNWQYDRYAYHTIKANGKRRSQRMHRLIMNPPKGLDVDHINSDKLDNRRSNLRICTRSQNKLNLNDPLRRYSYKVATSKYRGVSWDKFRSLWKADICYGGETHNLGRYQTETEARDAYLGYLKDKDVHLQ